MIHGVGRCFTYAIFLKNVPLKFKTKQTILDLRNQTKLSFSKGLIVDCMELRQTKTLPIMQSRTSLLLSNNFSQAFLVLGTTAGAYCGNYNIDPLHCRYILLGWVQISQIN